MARALLIIVPIAIALYALIDCARTPGEEMPARIPKAAWLIIILLFTVVGPIAWIITSRVYRAEKEGSIKPSVWSSDSRSVLRPNFKPQRPTVAAPDNDPEFLAQIDKQLRDKKRQEYQANHEQRGDKSHGEQLDERKLDDEGDTEETEEKPQ